MKWIYRKGFVPYRCFPASVILVLTLFFVSGCTLHEINFSAEPEVEAPVYSFQTLVEENSIDERAQPVEWWRSFGDPFLEELIDQALEENLSLKVVAERLSQAQSLEAQARARRFPWVDLEISSLQSWDEDQRHESSTLVGPSLYWDPDLFSRLRSSEIARQFEAMAQGFALEQARLTLSQVIAQTYYSALEQRLQLAVLYEQVQLDTELESLIEQAFDAGLVSRVDLLQQQGQRADTQSLIPPSRIALRQLENRLDVLLGSVADGIDRIGHDMSYPSISVEDKTVGVPNQLLLYRPNLKALQAQLISSDAEIARALAERFPLFELSAGAFYRVGSEGNGVVADILGSVITPLLDWSSRREEVKRTESRYREDLLSFSQAYLEAIEEVENSFYELYQQQEFVRRLKRRRDLLEETVEQTKNRYQGGLTDYLPVLDALKELRDTEQELVRQHRVFITTAVDLEIALGGKR